MAKIIARTLYFIHQSILRPNYILNNVLIFLDFCAQQFRLILFNLNPLYIRFGVLNHEKQHEEGICTVQGLLLYFHHFMQISVFSPNGDNRHLNICMFIFRLRLASGTKTLFNIHLCCSLLWFVVASKNGPSSFSNLLCALEGT